MSLPSYTVWFRGKPACPCLAEWLPWYEKVLLHYGVIKYCIDIAQLIGTYSKSGGTHAQGGAYDIWQYSDKAIWVARQMGSGGFPRTTGSFASSKHQHGILVNCPHNEPARYQLDELRAGGDGLVGSYPDPAAHIPFPDRGWREGIEWAKKLLGVDQPLPPKPPVVVPPKDDEGVRGPRFGYANVQSVPLMPISKVEADFKEMLEQCGVVGWGEIQPEPYKQALLKIDTHEHFHLDTECPISVRKEVWTARELTGEEMAEIREALKRVFGDDLDKLGIKVSGGHIQAHGGLEKTSPLRDICPLVITNRKGRTYCPVVTHMVSGPWDGKDGKSNDGKDLNDPWRSKMWDQHFRVMQVVLRVIRRLGYTTIEMGDHNRRNMPKFLKAQKRLDDDGIDHISWIPGDGPQIVGVISNETVPLNSDHDGEIVELEVAV